MADLAGPLADGFPSDAELALVRNILTNKPPDARVQITARLTADGIPAKALVRLEL